MDINSLLELLKVFWLVFEIDRFFIHRQKEKELVESVESLNQRLFNLEKSSKEKSLDD